MSQHRRKPVKLPDPDEAREKRDRQLALEVVKRGDQRGIRSQVARDHGVERWVVTRAMQTQGKWAAAHAKENPE